MRTIRQAIAHANAQLSRAGIENPRRTATTLLAHVLQKDMIYILTRPDETLAESVAKQFDEAVNRRVSGEPLQYITGHQEFYGLDFTVTPAVLIPRPETELIVKEVLQRNLVQAPLIIDVGTGSGCLAVALAVNLPPSHLIALDLSQAALEIARQNAERHRVADRIEFLESDLFSAIAGREPPIQADFIVANPPYVSESELPMLQREVREHEPRLAILSGEDSMTVQRRLFQAAPPFLKPGGYLICELGYGQYPAILKLVNQSLWQLIDVVRDLQGIERTLVLQRRELIQGAKTPAAAATHGRRGRDQRLILHL